MRTANQPRILFITGTDTGVGKTLLTSLLLCHLRRTGAHALALKPFCSGGRGDARRLSTLQDHELTLDEINPFFFPEPVAPLVGVRQYRRPIPRNAVLRHIRSIVAQHFPAPAPTSTFTLPQSQFLLIEGAGGLLVPLGENYSVLDLIAALDCEVLVVARNRLGTLNHCLLTVRALQQAGLKRIRLVMMECQKPDLSARTNPPLLAECLAPLPVLAIPFLAAEHRTAATLKLSATRLQHTLAALV